MNQIDEKQCDLSGLTDDDRARAEKVLENLKKLSVPEFMKPEDLLEGNQKLNIINIAELFNLSPELSITEKEKYEAAGLMNDDVGDSREERCN